MTQLLSQLDPSLAAGRYVERQSSLRPEREATWESARKPITFAQLTDTHILESRNAQMRECFTWHTLKAVVDRVAYDRVDGILLTGDLADTGLPEAYHLLRDLLAPLSIPIYWLPGNHDNPDSLAEILSGDTFSADKAFSVAGWRVILLNSVLPTAQSGEGHLDVSELDRLATELQEYPTHPSLIALHHHVLPVGVDWMDQIQLQNASELLSLLDRVSTRTQDGSPQVRLVLCGHVHLASDHDRQGTHYYSTPSTCLQILPTDTPPTPELQWPGYRLIRLYPSGHYETEVRRVTLGQTLGTIEGPSNT